jgi:HSP20 family protein
MNDSKQTPLYMIWILLVLLIIVLVIQGITVSKLYTYHHPESHLAKIAERVGSLEDAIENKARKLERRIGDKLVSDSESSDSVDESSVDTEKDLTPVEDWNPFQEIQGMRDRIDKMFGRSLERFREEPGFDLSWLKKPYIPAADFESKEDRYLITMDVPGMDKSQLEVSIEGVLLQIKGQREEIVEKKDGETLHTERMHGRFFRSFSLPGGIDPGQSKAEYKDGVLTITIPKGNETTGVSQKIEVK